MAFLVTAQLQTDVRFKEFGRIVELRINRALADAAAIALNAVIDAETRVGDASPTRKVSPGVHLRDSFQVSVVRRFAGAMGVSSSSVVVWTRNPNAIWQELGTRGRRRKAYKPSTGKPNNQFPFASQEGGNRGVAPLYFMRRAMRRAVPEIEALIRGALISATSFDIGSALIDTTSVHNPAKTPGVRSSPL